MKPFTPESIKAAVEQVYPGQTVVVEADEATVAVTVGDPPNRFTAGVEIKRCEAFRLDPLAELLQILQRHTESYPKVDGIVRPYSLRITVPAETEAAAKAISVLTASPRRGWSIGSATLEPSYLVLVVFLDQETSVEQQVDAIEKDLVTLGLPARSEWNP